MADLFNKLSHKGSRRWVVEGDIKGCFDHLNANHIQNQLRQWYVPRWVREVIFGMLKSKISHNGEVYDSESGTPQGSVISPLLANVALTTLDKFCQRFGWQYKAEGKTHNVNPIVRYADDFVIVCQTESEAKSIKNQISKHLCERVGVQLSDEKTHITHIAKGFNFLGFHFRKYNRYNRSQKPKRQKASWRDYLLLIKPQPEKVLNCKSKINTILISRCTYFNLPKWR